MDAAPLTLRSVATGDEGFVRALSRGAFGEYTLQAEERTWGILRAPGSTAVVALEDGAPVGFAVVQRVVEQVACLAAIAVAEERRGRGVGRTLLGWGEALARHGGARRIELVTAQANLAALQLFLRLGFEMNGRLPRYYPRGQDAVRLTKALG